MIYYPKLNRNATNRVTIPILDGGINQSDSCKNMADNQLINAKNVWFDKQSLRTRPTIAQIGAGEGSFLDSFIGINSYSEYTSSGVYSMIDLYYHAVATEQYSSVGIYGEIKEMESFTSYTVSDTITLGERYIDYQVKANSYKGTPTTKNGTGIYILISLYNDDVALGIVIYEVVHNDSENGINYSFHILYKNIGEIISGYGYTETDELYKPLIYINGKGNKYSELPTTNNTEYAPASVMEGKNLLPSGFRLQYISDGVSDSYIFPCKIDITNEAKAELNIAGFNWTDIKYNGEDYDEVTLKFTKSGGRAVYSAEEVYTYKENEVDKSITVSFTQNGFSFEDGDGNSLALPQSQTSNNIEIIAYDVDLDNYDKIVNMTVSAEYGGGSGIFGGSRVFLGGYKNFICFSTAQSSTYFSENNYISVGDSSSVTAFAKMNDLLVIFKPNSIYATQTTYADSISADSVQSGAVADISTTYCYFPIYQLTNEVGCDIPKSIKLCLNRLIFANTSNDVYCLVTQSNASQRNVYCLSEQIKKKLDLTEYSYSAVFSDYYLLFSGKKVYILNYNKDSYRYIYSYTNRTNNTSTRYLTWWYWEIDESFSGAVSYKNKVYLILKKTYGHTVKTHYYLINENVSDDKCEVLIESKVFDFGIPERYKKIEKIYLGVGNDEYAEINLSVNTDKGEVFHRPLIINDDEKNSTADCGQEIRLIPFCNKIRQFNIKLEATGVVSLDGLAIYYKQMGEIMS